MQPTLQKLPALSDQATQTLTSIRKLADDTRKLSNSLDQMTAKLQASGGAVERFSSAADQVSAMAVQFQDQALPLTRDMQSSMRSLNRTLDRLNERPQSILFGPGTAPGPGEAGYSAPAGVPTNTPAK